MAMSVSDYRRALRTIFDAASTAGSPYVDVRASDLYAKSGATTADAQMPNCCSVMHQEARTRATVLPGGPPRGQGPTLTIRYQLPR